MAYHIIWSDAAIEDLQNICAQIAAENPDAARRTGEAILKHVGILSEFPEIGPTYPRGTSGPLREIVNRPYRVFYDVDDTAQTVTILHVRHGARQVPKF